MAEESKGFEKCLFCGKWISSESALENLAGHRCEDLQEQGWTKESLFELRQSKTVDEIPETEDGRPWIKVAALHKKLVREGIPVARMVKAMGGDRGVDEVLHDKFNFVYVGRARFLHPDCAGEWGLQFLRSMAGRSSGNGKDELAKELAK